MQHLEEMTSSQSEQICCRVVELRQYTLHPGKRDVLIELFEREFIETHEALNMKVIGQFRVLGDPNLFVWLRGFQDMASRAQGLKNLYGGPVWKTHREAANATIVDSDNVLLLRPADPDSGFSLRIAPPAPGSQAVPESVVVATTYHLHEPAGDDFIDFFKRELKPALSENGVPVLACFVTENSANNFPNLPVREGENVFVWFSGFQNRTAFGNESAALARSKKWSDKISEELAGQLKRKPEVLILSPTSRSQLRG